MKKNSDQRQISHYNYQNQDLQIFESLLSSQKQWAQHPQIIHLTLKSLLKYLSSLQNKVQNINQKIEDYQFVKSDFDAKINNNNKNFQNLKKQLQKNIEQIRKSESVNSSKIIRISKKSSNNKNEIQNRFIHQNSSLSISQDNFDYDEVSNTKNLLKMKLKQEGLDRTMIQQVKTIALALIQQRMGTYSNHLTQNYGQKLSYDKQQNLQQRIRTIEKQFQKLKISNNKFLQQNKGLGGSSAVMTMKQLQIQQNNVSLSVGNTNKNNQINNRIIEEIKFLKNEINNLTKNLSKKLQKEDVQQQLKYLLKIKKQSVNSNQFSFIQSQTQGLKKMVQQLMNKKIDKKEFADHKIKIGKQISQKAKLNQIQEIIKTVQNQLTNKLLQLKNQIKKIQKQVLKSTVKQNQRKKQGSPINQQKKMSNPTNNGSFQIIKSSLNRVQKTINQRLMVNQTQSKCQNCQLLLKQQLKSYYLKIQAQLKLRDIKLCQTIQQSKLKIKKDISQNLKNQNYQYKLSAITEQLVIGKWLSTSHQLSNSGLIQWETQATNTFKQIYQWTQKSTSILVVAPGVYRIQFGYFSINKSNSAHLLLNGQYIMKIKEDQTKQFNKKHPNGMIGGNTITEYIILPARGRLSVQVSRDCLGQAYLGLHRI